MKLQFKKQAYQTKAVQAVVDCFKGQPKQSAITYTIDPGTTVEGAIPKNPQIEMFADSSVIDEYSGFKNANHLPLDQLLANIKAVQQSQNLPISSRLNDYRDQKGKPMPASYDPGADINIDIEMETGTGKTYVYIKTMFELYEQYGWSKFIVVVPSIAIREGVSK